MSFISKLTALFSKTTSFTKKENKDDSSNSQENPVITNPTGTKSGSVPLPVSHENVINIYGHGFSNGLYRIEPEKDTFEDFLEAGVKMERLTEQRQDNKNQLAELKYKVEKDEESFRQLQEIVIEKENAINTLKLSIADAQTQKTKFESAQNSLISLRENTVPEYAWIPALLFLVAGLVFIAGDISITSQITSYGFDMNPKEGWIFAVGLAFTAFLIKPLLDRLLEKPFQKAGYDLKSLYRYVLLAITTLGIIMLFCLGKFRSVAKNYITKEEEISTRLGELSDTASPEYIKLAQELKELNEAFTNNFFGEYGIIFSGIIFAIGGALCLAVAFPSLTKLINRYWILPFRISAIKRKIEKIENQINDLRDKISSFTSEKEIASQKLQVINIHLLYQEIAALENEQKRLQIEFFEIQYQKERSLYRDGRNRGEKYGMDGELIYKINNDDPTSFFKNGNGNNGHDEKTKLKRSYNRRPFIKIRKMIADNYNKTQNKNINDDTEFEIVA